MIITYRRRNILPDTVAGLGLWYDAGVNVTLNAGDVETWQSRAGKLFSITQGTAAYRPVYDDGTGANAINGYPTMRVGGLKWNLSTAQDIVQNKPGQTLFGVFRLKSFDGNDGAVFSVSRGVIGHELISGTRYFTYRWRKNLTDSFTSIQGPTGTADSLYIMWGVSNYESGSEETKLIVNGLEYAGSTPSSGNTENTGARILTAYATAASSTFNRVTCDLAECGVYERALTDDEIETVSSYFKTKYGVSY